MWVEKVLLWIETITTNLVWLILQGNKESWLQAQVDHTLFYRKSLNGKISILIIYVDDILITNSAKVERMKCFLTKLSEIKDLGPMKYLIGMEVARSKRVSRYSKGSIPLTYSKKSVSLEVNQHVLQSRQIIRLGLKERFLLIREDTKGF